MSISDKIREAIKNELLKARPLMNIERVHEELLQRLSEIKSPAFPDIESWNKNIRVFPPDENEQEESEGGKVRFAVNFYTKENQYLITIIENLGFDSRDVYIISVIVNWSSRERRDQQLVDRAYTGHFEDNLRGRHTLWAQTFQIEELNEAFNNCLAAILGNELVEKKGTDTDSMPLPDIYPHQVSFPDSDENEE